MLLIFTIALTVAVLPYVDDEYILQLISVTVVFLPRDAYAQRGICRSPVSISPSQADILSNRLDGSSCFLAEPLFSGIRISPKMKVTYFPLENLLPSELIL